MPLPIFYYQGGGGNLDRILEKRKEKFLMMEEKRNEQVWLGIATHGDGLDWESFSVKSTINLAISTGSSDIDEVCTYVCV